MSSITAERSERKPSTRKKSELRPASGSASMRIALKSGEWTITPWTSQAGEDGFRLSREGEEAVIISDLFPIFRGMPIVLRIVADTKTRGEVETHYGLTEIDVDPMEFDSAYQLAKSDGENYTVTASQFGAVCTCGDFLFRRSNAQDESLRDCKHARSLKAFRLI